MWCFHTMWSDICMITCSCNSHVHMVEFSHTFHLHSVMYMQNEEGATSPFVSLAFVLLLVEVMWLLSNSFCNYSCLLTIVWKKKNHTTEWSPLLRDASCRSPVLHNFCQSEPRQSCLLQWKYMYTYTHIQNYTYKMYNNYTYTI